MNIADELNVWSDETARAYNLIANEYGENAPAFYAQSDLTKIKSSPRIFIMGINPGSGGTYKEQCEKGNDYWNLDGKPMDGYHLLKGNPAWKNKEAWSFWTRLTRFFPDGNALLSDDGDCVVTNATFFATPNVKSLLPGLLAKTLPYTLKLIEILRPKLLVVLSGKSLLNMIKKCGGGQIEYSSAFTSYKRIFTGRLCGIPCCGVPHPSASLFMEECELIKKVITHIYNDEAVNQKECQPLLDAIVERKKRNGTPKEEMAELYNVVTLRMDALPYRKYESGRNYNRYDLDNGLQLTVANNSTTHGIGIRLKKWNVKNDLDKISIPHIAEMLGCFDKFSYVTEPQWLGFKDFKNVMTKGDIEHTANGLVDEIKHLVDEINSFLI